MSIDPKLQKLLDAHDVEYEVLHHAEDFRAHATASHTHTPFREFAKTVVLCVDDVLVFAVIPASHHIALSRFQRSVGCDDVRLARESEMAERMTDCDVGAEPPFGSLYGLDTYASAVLARDDQITFNAGTHRDAVRMAWADYERIAQPRIVAMSRHEEEGPG